MSEVQKKRKALTDYHYTKKQKVLLQMDRDRQKLDWRNIKRKKYLEGSFSERLELGPPSCVCEGCGAIMWLEERIERLGVRNPKFNLCCFNGKIKIPLLPQTPELLSYLLTSVDDFGKDYRNKIRLYNSAFAFTSMGANVDHEVTATRGPYCYKIHGAVYHQIGSLIPQDGNAPKFAQLYIYDTENEISNRGRVFSDKTSTVSLNPTILASIKNMLDIANPYVKVFRHVRNWRTTSEEKLLHLRILEGRKHGIQYSRPTADEVAILVVGNATEIGNNRDIVVLPKDGSFKTIKESHPAYMPLQYPLLFPYGEDGWKFNMIHDNSASSTSKRCKITMLNYYSFRLQMRATEGHTLLRSGKLLQQYIVDAYAAIEAERLTWYRRNQDKIRAETYENVNKAVNKGVEAAKTIGRRFILPSSFTGGPRYMIQNYQDAMALCAWAGSADIFLTFTCNPNWSEIKTCLSMQGINGPSNRPDILARVFNMKVKKLRNDIVNGKLFGEVISDIFAIEFQKRGLPHVHMLITLAPENKIKDADDIDQFISAEIPDPTQQPLAFETVSRSMVHGPCGEFNPKSPCMVDGKCSKHYPKKFVNRSSLNSDCYPIYRRRDNGRVIKIRNIELDNRWIVPYNIDLLTKYDAHINVELCTNGRAIKYLYKYVHKGFDRAHFLLEKDNETIDEIKSYMDCRYISAIESCWRIFNFDLHHRFPSVQRLVYHLPGQQSMIFKDDDSLSDLVSRPHAKTMLTEWFMMNRISEAARSLTYVQFPQKWVWDEKQFTWKPRKQGMSVGRLPMAKIESGDHFYLRMLLHVVRGACSYEDLRSVNDITYNTFKETCYALGLLDDDAEWDNALLEATNWATAWQLRHLFVSILLFGEVTNVGLLWEKYWEDLSDDFQRRTPSDSMEEYRRLSYNELKQKTLLHLEYILNRNGKTLSDIPSMPIPSKNSGIENRLIFEELDYDKANTYLDYRSSYEKLNQEQKVAFEAITSSVDKVEHNLFFIYGGGGTGKTFLWKTLLAKFRHEGHIVLAVASSGIASLLLPGGRTAHSRFKIPLDLDSCSTCSISQQSDLAELIRQSKMVIWDEAPMMHKNAFDAVDRTFRDILTTKNKKASEYVFGGMTVVFGGDFRQILPVIPKASSNEIIANSIHRSNAWRYCKVFLLKTNMRLSLPTTQSPHSETSESFAKWILDIGNGCVPPIYHDDENDEDWINIPEDLLISDPSKGIDMLIDFVYPDLLLNFKRPSYLCSRAILAPRNDEIDELNSMLCDRLPTIERIYCSCDSALQIDGKTTGLSDIYTPEYLHSLNFNGVPPHILKLKIGCPIILLRNINQSIGLCNGTRLIVKALHEKILDAEFITGNNTGERAYIPRIVFLVTNTKSNFLLKRRQFPVKLSFAMTINKSQGQTLDFVGLYLKNPVFCHGQLYVALSRATSRNGVKIFIPQGEDQRIEGCTKNVVYKEVFEEVQEKISCVTFL